MVSSASFIFLAMSAFERSFEPEKRDSPCFGSSRIWRARMDALATALSTDGGRWAAAIVLYDGCGGMVTARDSES